MNRDELIKFLIDQYRSDEVLAFDIWNVKDVQNLAEGVSKETAEKVLIKVYKEKDCDDGITNSVILETIDNLETEESEGTDEE